MLPATARLTRRVDFAAVVRRGRRSGRHLLVVHVLSTSDGPARAGFVVSKAVGGSVIRHRVLRRLRHVLRPRLDQLAAGTHVVVRALPPSADASSAELAVELDTALHRLGLTPVESP
ncbi:MAG: ribonuclease P protein component [Pseudonocardiales bacterium]|nr:ribonuclease P protein component [Pseudonocardiales bacterium]